MEGSDDNVRSHGASYSAGIVSSEATTNTLASAFKKLSVENQEIALAAVQVRDSPPKGLRRGANGWGLDEIGGIADKDETLFDIRPDLAEWKELCRACGVELEEIPGSITKCKEVCKLQSTSVNTY